MTDSIDTLYMREARYQATQDVVSAILKSVSDTIAIHGNDPKTPQIVAAAFAIALRRMGQSMDADIPKRVHRLLGEFAGR